MLISGPVVPMSTALTSYPFEVLCVRAWAVNVPNTFSRSGSPFSVRGASGWLRSRRWFPVGRLVHNDSGTFKYEFSYTEGARQAKESDGFFGIPGFPSLDRGYQADHLFPAFMDRTMNLGRPDRAGYLSGLGLDEGDWDALAELCVSGGLSMSDSFEVFPEIEPDGDGRFETRFVLHGLRHLNKHAIERSESLRVGDVLRLSFELNNPATSHAILVSSDDYYTLGWLPRYLVDCMHRDGAWLVEDVEVSVAKVNPYAR